MQVHNGDVDCGSPSVTTRSSMNVQLSSQPLPDLRWKPSQGITFHNSTTTRTYATKGATPRTTASYGVGPPRKSSLLTAASATSKNTRNSVPVLPYIPRKPSTTQIAEFAPEQDHHTVERGFVDLGNDFDTLGQALADAGVGEYGAKDQTWNTWEPINFITEASTAGMQDVSLSVKLAEKKQVAAQREKDLQMARDLAAQLEEQAFKVAARKEEKARQVASQREIESRKALLASQAVANVGSTDPRENIGVLALDTTNGIVSWGELARRDALLRKELEKAEQEAAAAKALRSRLDASYKAKLLNQTYKAIKELFEPAAAGYGKLIDALTQSQDDYPQLTICWIRNISELREEFRKYAHQYREIVRLRKSRDYTVTTEGKRPTQTSAVWRRRVRNYYLESPFNEQDVFASMSMQAMYSVSPLRHQQGLRRLLDPVKLQRNTRALRVAGLNFIAGVKEKDALEFDWADQESRRMLDPILNGLKKLQPLCNQLRSLRRFWLKEYQGHDGISARPARLGLWQCSFDLEKNMAFIKEHVNEAEEAVEKRVERQLLKRAQERSPVLLSKYSPSVSDSQSHHKSQELNLRPTALRNQVFFVGSDLVKQRTSATEDQDPCPSSLNPALPNPDQVQPPVSFHIPEDVKRQAILASSSPGTTYWKYTMYQNPDGEKVTVHYCKSKEASERIAKLFLDKPVIGFDIEWKPQASALEGTKKNVSLIQLASEERIALFHIARYGKDGTIDDLVAPTLKKIMESPEIIKVGVAVKADCTRLRKFMGIGSRGLLELSHLYKLVKFSSGDVKKINKSLVALAQQVEEHFQLPMWKGEVRSSDWSEELNFEQIQYAASDSYAGLQLYNVMEAKRKAIEPMPPCPAHAELNLPIRLANGQTVATYNEPEEIEEEGLQSESVTNSDQLPDVAQMAREFLNIAIEDVPSSEIPASEKVRRPPKSRSEKSPEVAAAELWVADWRSKLPDTYKPKATPAYLRAYAVWHEQELGVQEIASLLRDPPLQVTTVSNYILEAIRMEKLPYDLLRLKNVLGHIPQSISKGRYQALKRQLE